jgi:hypothetical protein
MKNAKNHGKGKGSELASLRSVSAYQGARGFLGVPFILFGSLFCAGAALAMVMAFTAGGSGIALGLLASIIALICGLFCFGIVALAGALFDVADCALRGETRAMAREAREAYEAYRNQHGENAP